MQNRYTGDIGDYSNTFCPITPPLDAHGPEKRKQASRLKKLADLL